MIFFILVAVINSTKDDITKDLFDPEDSFHKKNRELQDVRYSEMFDVEPEDENHFSNAYSVFQKLQLTTEIILLDLKHNHPSKTRLRHIWRSVNNLIFNIIKNLFIELSHQQLPRAEPLTRSLIPRYFRCVHHSSYRDVRDFVILKHVLEEAKTYLDVFD